MARKLDSPRQRVRKYFLANPTASNYEIINATGASARTVSYVRTELVAEGLIVRSGWGRPASDTEALQAAANREALQARQIKDPNEGLAEPADEEERQERDNREEVEAELDRDLQDMTPEEIRHEMVRLLRNKATPPPVRVSAAALLEKLRTETAEELGPGAPLSYEDAKFRLMLLMRACGPEMTIEAVQDAFNLGKAMNEVSQATQPSEPSSPSAEAPSASDDATSAEAETGDGG